MFNAIRAGDVPANLDDGPDGQAEQAPVLVSDARLPEQDGSGNEVQDGEKDCRGEGRIVEVNAAGIQL
jgi:hypothetical protein